MMAHYQIALILELENAQGPIPKMEFDRQSEQTWDRSVVAEVTKLFEQFRAPLFRYLVSFGLRDADCEEVVQETFLALYRHLKKNEDREHVRGWIFRVGHNLALKIRQTRLRDVPLDEAGAHPDLLPDPERQAAFSEWQDQMIAIYGALPELDRECLSLRAEGLRYREIAGVLGISLGSVAQSLARSIAKLQRASARHEARR